MLACVNAVASGIASLPVYVYRPAPGGGRQEAPEHPVARLLRRPHPRLSWPDVSEFSLAQVLLHGNALFELVRDRAGRVVELRPIPWSRVNVVQLPSGRLAYDVTEGGERRRLLEDDVIHLRDRSDDGLVGRSRLSRAAPVLANALGLQAWSQAMWERGGSPSGVIRLPGVMSDEAFERFKAQMQEQHTGLKNLRRMLILEGGGEWQANAVSPEDAEMLASRRFATEEICRVFGVPPPIVQSYEHNTFTNSAQASLWFASNTLAPWCRKLEAVLSAALFGADDDSMSIEIDLSGMMRGDYSARWEANVKAVAAGILTVDEVRQQEGWNPLPAAPNPAAEGGT